MQRTSLLPTEQFAPEQFEIEREIGRGGMGVVYQARDRRTGEHVALKLLDGMGGEPLLRFKNEFRALADLAHPNLLRLGELFCQDGQWFFTMELIHGCSFLEYVRPESGAAPEPELDDEGATDDAASLLALLASDPGASAMMTASSIRSVNAAPGELADPAAAWSAAAASSRPAPARYSETRLRAVLLQLARAIDALHRAGRVHRDIKPSNVLVDTSGRAVLLDFGLVGELGRDLRAKEKIDKILGTPYFMAPEQAVSAKVGPAADWYAFGVMLFMALTGVPPFQGTSEQILAAKRARPAPAPSALVTGIPPDLDALCTALMRIDPLSRPTNAEILTSLGAGTGSAASSERSINRDMPFFGRDDELAALGTALAQAAAGGTAAVRIEGEPGMGKSALVRHFLSRAARGYRGMVVLQGRCYQQEAVPFRAFDAIVDELSTHLASLPDAEIQPCLQAGIAALAAVFPVLRRVPLIAELAGNPSRLSAPAERRAQAFSELRALLAAMAEQAPLVLFIDDLQWADDNSLALLAHLLDAPCVPGCLFLATMRTRTEPSAQAEHPVLERFQTLRLGGLPREQAVALLTALLDDSALAGQKAPSDMLPADLVLEEAGGHPLLLSELARWLCTAANPASAAPTASPASAAPTQTSISKPRLLDVLWQRIAALEPDARRFMELVALVGVPVPLAVIAVVAELGDRDQQLLTDLRAARLVRLTVRDGRHLVELYHDRIREAVHAHAPEDDQAALHLAIGRALLAHTPETRLEADIFTIVRHLTQGAALITDAHERRQVVELCLRAARVAKRATAFAAAVGHVEQGLALLGADCWNQAREQAWILERERMEIAYLGGQLEQGAACFAALLARARDRLEQAALYEVKIRLDTERALPEEALRTGRQALALFGVALPARGSMGTVLREYARLRWHQGRRSIVELSALPELRNPHVHALMQLLAALAAPAFFVSNELYTTILLRLASLSIQHGVTGESAYAFAAYGVLLAVAFRKHADAYALGERGALLIERTGRRDLEPKVCLMQGAFLMPRVRPFAEARAQLARAQTGARAYGDVLNETFSASFVTMHYLHQGSSLAELLASAEHSLQVARRCRHKDMTCASEVTLRYGAVLRGQSGVNPQTLGRDDADDELLAAMSVEQTPSAVYLCRLLRAEIGYLQGDLVRAWQSWQEAEQLVRIVRASPSLMLHCFNGALIASQRLSTLGNALTWIERNALRRIIQTALTLLEPCALSCPENFTAYHSLIAAERACLDRAYAAAAELYYLAAEAARRHGMPRYEALALELHSSMTRMLGQDAHALEQAAADAYERWGAVVKAAALRSR